MGITKMAGSTKENDMFIAALQGKPISYSHPDTLKQMMTIMTIVSILDKEQREDFLILNQQGYCTIPEGVNGDDIWKFLETRTPEQFKEFYIICSKKREVAMKVRRAVLQGA